MKAIAGWLALLAAGGVAAQDLAVYDDAVRNGFADYSYGGGSDFAQATIVRTGTNAIAFTPNNFNAAAFAHPTQSFAQSQYVGARLWVHGGATGGQSLTVNVYLGDGGMAAASGSLASYVAGGSIGANEWRLAEIRFANAPISYAGSYMRFELQAAGSGAQPTLYIDDVALISATRPDAIFRDDFEGDAVAPPAGMLRFTPASPDLDVDETSGPVTFMVERVGGTFGAIGTTVALGGDAANPADYTSSALALSWANGDATNRTVTITPVVDDVDEAPENVTLTLGAPTGGATLAAPSSATLTIRDADLLFAPQWATNSIKVYRRGPMGFAPLTTASLGAGVNPNALAFAPDGKLWVVDENRRLLRYARSAIVAGGSPAAEATITAPDSGSLFQLAFFGDFAYVSQSDFGGTHQVLKYPLASLAASGAPLPAILTNASLDVPSGLAFDPQGRLWVANTAFNNAARTSIVRIDTTTGAVDRTATNVAVSGRNSLIRPEGLAFDAAGTLWVGNNGEQTIVAYSAAQIAAGLGAVAPVHVIDASPGAPLVDGTYGGLAFDPRARLWANWQQSPFEQREYVVATANGGASYTSTAGQAITNATTFPGFGGIAFWPPAATLHRSGGGPVVAMLDHDTDVAIAGMTSDRFTWVDAGGSARSVALAHNDKGQGPTAVGGYPNHGGAMREYAFAMPNGNTRIATVTTYGNGGFGGFGYVVSHARFTCGGDDSPLGYGTPGTFERLATGRHHAIFRFRQNYPRRCNANGVAEPTTVPVTIDWFFSTGRDHPIWSITYDLSGFAANRFFDDSRAPYGELNIDGDGFAHDISGVAWGDRFKFSATTAGGVHLNSPWSYVGANTVPYVKLWIDESDATMGTVQTQTIDQQDAGGGRYAGYDIRQWWNETSAGNPAGGTYSMPQQNEWPYQANAFSIGVGVANNNARLTWGTQYGFLGQSSYPTNNQLPASSNTGNASGTGLRSYATYVVLGAHSTSPVEAQVAEVEAIQQTTLTASVGSVRLQGTAGPGRIDNAPYSPAGWDHVYGVWTVEVAGNAADGVADADFNFAIGGGLSLRNPVLNVRNWQGTALPASVTFNGVPLVQDVDYFPSIVDDADELLITLSRTLSGAANRVVVSQ